MRSLACAAAVVALFTAGTGNVGAAQTVPSASQPPSAASSPGLPAGLIGTWDATNRSHGGIGSTVILGRDSAFVLVLGAMVDGEYRIKGQDFTIIGEDDGSGQRFTETQKLTFAGDTAVLSAKGCAMKLTPLEAGIPANSLVGKWRMIHLTGVPAYEEFSADGSVRLRVPIVVQKGKYRVTGDSIAFHTITPAPEDWVVGFTMAGDTLTVSNSLGQHRYLHARELIPPEVQQPVPPARMLCKF